MTEVYEIVNLAKDGSVANVETKRTWYLPVVSTDVIPKGCPIYTQAFIVDKVAVAFCDGRDNWYMDADKPVIAGETWAALFR